MAEQPVVTEGPKVNNNPTKLTLLSSAHLREYPYLKELVDWANPSFIRSHKHLLPEMHAANAKRFSNTEKFLDEIAVKDSFTYLITSDAEAESCDAPVYHATISGRPFSGHRISARFGLEQDSLLYEEMEAKGIQQWEIKTVIVSPLLQGLGFGRLIMKLAEAEVLKRFQQGKLHSAEVTAIGAGHGNKTNGELKMPEKQWEGVQVMLTLLTAVNEGFYRKCGYREWARMTMPEGTFHSKVPFDFSWMIKDLAV